ncbi:MULTISPECIES: phosphotransferase [unclassified Nonomuraea]|uniref:phosphotransferase n=1 Tax=unclassified Nonomuraea TaxID=2593643 RepID=UPI0033E81F68
MERFTRWIRTRPLRVVVLAPDAAAVERRERERAKTGSGAWTIAQLDATLRAGTPRIGLWLDTSAQSPAETVDEILARADEALVGGDRI